MGKFLWTVVPKKFKNYDFDTIREDKADEASIIFPKKRAKMNSIDADRALILSQYYEIFELCKMLGAKYIVKEV